MANTRVLMIETPIFSHFVKNATRRAIFGMEIVDVSCQMQNALELVRAHQPDVLVVDLRGQSIGIFDTLRKISIEYPQVLVIGRSKKDTGIDFVLDAVSAGVMGFINDLANCDELLDAIKTVRQGYPYFPQNVIHQVVLNLQAQYVAVNG